MVINNDGTICDDENFKKSKKTEGGVFFKTKTQKISLERVLTLRDTLLYRERERKKE